MQYYLNLQPGSDHNLTDLRLQLAELAQMHADMQRRLVEEASVGMDLVLAGLVQAAGEGNDKGNGKERNAINEVNPVWMETVRRCIASGIVCTYGHNNNDNNYYYYYYYYFIIIIIIILYYYIIIIILLMYYYIIIILLVVVVLLLHFHYIIIIISL